eukprot:14279823-Alexandrium_andersonii.AAC.1
MLRLDVRANAPPLGPHCSARDAITKHLFETRVQPTSSDRQGSRETNVWRTAAMQFGLCSHDATHTTTALHMCVGYMGCVRPR